MLIETCHCHTPISPRPGDVRTEQNVIGAWAACPECARAIRANDPLTLARLAERSLREREPEAFAQPLPPLTIVKDGQARHVPAGSWADFYQAVHIAFWQHREGSES